MNKQIPRDAFWRKYQSPTYNPAPELMGRQIDECDAYQRSATELVATAQAPMAGCIVGTAKAEIFRSTCSMDDGGFVLRLTSDNESGFVPHAININDGIELHVAGGDEGTAVLQALQAAVSVALTARLS